LLVFDCRSLQLGIDLYTILNREAFRAMKEGKPRFLAWEWLHEQTGNEYGRLDHFRRDALTQIKAVLAVHPGLIITIQKGRKGQQSGLVISNLSTPSIPHEAPREVQPRCETTGMPTPLVGLPSLPPSERHLRPETVAIFRTYYRDLDPYACKTAFDFWAENLPPHRKPRHYDKAFLGFAETWSKGKL
jgi:hypothetical protein